MDNEEDFAKLQYTQCFENYRTQDKYLWQVPSLLLLINSAIFGVIYGLLGNQIIVISILLLFGTMISFTMLVTVTKHRYFQKCAIHYIKELDEGYQLKEVGSLLITNEAKNKQPIGNKLTKLSAGNWTIYSIITMFIGLMGVFYYSLYEWYIENNVVGDEFRYIPISKTGWALFVFAIIATAFFIFGMIFISQWFIWAIITSIDGYNDFKKDIIETLKKKNNQTWEEIRTNSQIKYKNRKRFLLWLMKDDIGITSEKSNKKKYWKK